MKKIDSYGELELLLNSVNGKVNFKYNGTNHGAMIANDGRVIVKNFKTGVTVGKKQFLSQVFYNSSTYVPKIELPAESASHIKIQKSDYDECLTFNTLLDEFVEYMQILQFRREYEEHPNIGLFDFDKLKELYPILPYRNKKNVLFAKVGDNYNINVKWKEGEKWRSIKGTKASLGAFFKAKKQTSTLILTEGLKDGINANIAFPTADILANNGKSNPYNFKAWDIDLRKYRYIIFANDRDVTGNEFITMFPMEYKEHFKKTKYINWDLVEHGKDLSDIIEKLIVPICKTKRDRERKALPLLKKLLHKENFQKKYIEARREEAEKTLKIAIENDNKAMVMRAIKSVNLFEGNLIDGAKYYLTKQNQIKGQNYIINLDKSNRLNVYVDDIKGVLDINQIVFLNAPTGTGKSYTSLQDLPKHYNNIIIISPLRMVTNQHGAYNTPFTNVRFDDNFNAVQADLNSNYIAITTDVFSKLWIKFKDEFIQRLKQADLIIFDEQHLYYDSLGFRDETVVKCYEYLLYRHNGKVLFMSGTPILPSDKKVSLITAKVLEENKKIIKFFYNPFNDTSEIIESIKRATDKGAVLIYVNSRKKVKELQNLLSDIDTLGITSYEYIHNGKKVDEKILDKDLGNIVYISTTKATTGVNFKHLMTIYQYGTPYTPNTFIQLMARLRNGGGYFVINPKFKQQRERYNAKRAIGLSLVFQRLDVKKVSDSFYGDDFQEWLRKFVLLPQNNEHLEGFYKTYNKAFQLIEAKGLGKFNEDNSDFVFSGHNVLNIDELFIRDDENEFRKYIEQIIIDWVIEHNVEMLNELYNLSFRIVNATYKASGEKHQLITDEDKEAKKADRKKIKDELRELHEKIDKKLENIGITAKYLKKQKFSDTELSKLNSKQLHIDKLKKISDARDKAIALKFYLIPKSVIFKVANKLIAEKGYLTIKELDEALQKIFITNSRLKNPYEKLLIELFTSEIFNNSYLKFTKAKKINKKLTYNVLEISKEYKQYFNDLKTKRAKEKYLKERMKEFLENCETTPYDIEEELEKTLKLEKEILELRGEGKELQKVRKRIDELQRLRQEAEEVF